MRRSRTETSALTFHFFLFVVGISITQAFEVNKNKEVAKGSVLMSKITGFKTKLVSSDLKNDHPKGQKELMRSSDEPSESLTISDCVKHKPGVVLSTEDSSFNGLEKSKMDKSNGNRIKLEESTKDQKLFTREFEFNYYGTDDDGYPETDPRATLFRNRREDDYKYKASHAKPSVSSHSISFINDWDGGWNSHRRYFDPISEGHFALNPKRLALAKADSIERQLRNQYGPNAMINVSVNGNRFMFEVQEDDSEYDIHPPWDPEYPPTTRTQKEWYDRVDRMRRGHRGVITLPQVQKQPKWMDLQSPNFRRGTSIRDNDFMIIDGKGMYSYMDPTDLIDTIEELNRDPSLFYVTFACEPKIGRYICKAQCVERGDGMTGTCDTGFCQCIGKDEKKLRKRLGIRFRSAMDGFRHDCKNKAYRCKIFCKYLTIEKDFIGMCSDDNVCKCVTNPVPPEQNKKTICAKAIKKMQKLENLTLQTLGFKGVNAPIQYGTVSPETEKIVRQLHASDQFKGCTEEEIRNLRDVIHRLSNAMNTLKDIGTPLPSG